MSWTLTLTHTHRPRWMAVTNDRYAGCLAIDCFSFRESSHTLSSPAVRRHSLTHASRDEDAPFFSPHTCSSRVAAVSISHTLFGHVVFPFLSIFRERVWNLCYRFASSFTANNNNNNNICRNHSHKYSHTPAISSRRHCECTSEKFANFSELIVNLPRKQNRLELVCKNGRLFAG